MLLYTNLAYIAYLILVSRRHRASPLKSQLLNWLDSGFPGTDREQKASSLVPHQLLSARADKTRAGSSCVNRSAQIVLANPSSTGGCFAACCRHRKGPQKAPPHQLTRRHLQRQPVFCMQEGSFASPPHADAVNCTRVTRIGVTSAKARKSSGE